MRSLQTILAADSHFHNTFEFSARRIVHQHMYENWKRANPAALIKRMPDATAGDLTRDRGK
jgi:hypothetical protein